MSKYIDEVVTSPNEEDSRQLSKTLSNHFTEKIAGILARYSTLDTIEMHNSDCKSLFMEARELYLQEFYYSCVVIAGSVAECVLRKLFLDKVSINMSHLSQGSEKYLGFIQAKTICEILVSEGTIKRSLLPSFKLLGELRSKYSTVTAKSPKEDAERALHHLDKVLHQVDLSDSLARKS